jgi:hypothetical protein
MSWPAPRVSAAFAAVEAMMSQFDPELVQLMRSVLEDVMTRVPPEIAGTTTRPIWLKLFSKPRRKDT